MPLPLADFDKRPVVFIDALSPMLSEVYRAFDVLFVLTSNVARGRSREAVASLLEQAGLSVISQHLAAEWATPYEADSNLEEQVEAWHATARDRTPTSYLVVTTKERGACLGHTLMAYAVVLEGPRFTNADYLNACRVLHSQVTFEPFNPDWY
jgi:hypothetical protein